MFQVFSKKEWALISAFSTLTPIAIAALAVRVFAGDADSAVASSVAVTPPPQAMIKDCVLRVSDAMQASSTAVRVDSRSTGYREQRFNVHGNIIRSTGTYDFQCWYQPDGHFQTKQIGNHALEPIIGG